MWYLRLSTYFLLSLRANGLSNNFTQSRRLPTYNVHFTACLRPAKKAVARAFLVILNSIWRYQILLHSTPNLKRFHPLWKNCRVACSSRYFIKIWLVFDVRRYYHTRTPNLVRFHPLCKNCRVACSARVFSKIWIVFYVIRYYYTRTLNLVRFHPL